LTTRDRPWWEELADVLPDPWGVGDDEPVALTPDQEAFLLGVVDQPPVPRVSDGDWSGEDSPGDATGKVPGDAPTEDP
jgi:hypothetical protein